MFKKKGFWELRIFVGVVLSKQEGPSQTGRLGRYGNHVIAVVRQQDLSMGSMKRILVLILETYIQVPIILLIKLFFDALL